MGNYHLQITPPSGVAFTAQDLEVLTDLARQANQAFLGFGVAGDALVFTWTEKPVQAKDIKKSLIMAIAAIKVAT